MTAGRKVLLQGGVSFLIVLYFLVFFWKAGDYSIWSKVLKLSSDIWLFLIAYSFINYILRAFRWSLLIRQINWELSYSFLTTIYLFGFLFSASPGKVGELFRCYLLSKYSIPYFKSFSIFLFERMSDLVVICGFVLLIFVYECWVYVLAAIAFLLLVVFVIFKLHSLLSIFRGVAQFLVGMQGQLLRMVTFSNLSMSLLLGVLAWAVQGFVLLELLLEFGVELPVLTVIGVYALSVLLGGVSMLPGGVGVVELSLAIILIGLGVSEEVAVTCSLLTRVFTLWLSILVGGVASIVFWFLHAQGKVGLTTWLQNR